MAISPQLRQFKSSGVYRLEFDKSQTSNINVGTLRVLVGHSKKGPFNTPVLIENVEDFKNVYGDIDKNLEKIGMFFHRSCKAALTRGPILALNLKDVSSDTGNWVSMYTDGSDNNAGGASLTASGNSAYGNFHDMDKFMKPTDTQLLSTATTDNNKVIAFTNLHDSDLTIIARTAQEIDGFEVTAEEWYGNGNVPTYLHDKDYLSDFMIDVFVFKGTFTPSLLDTDPVFGNYFSATGLLKDKLDEFSNLRNVTLLAKYTGSLLPGFKTMEGQNVYIESMINAEARRTGLFCAIDEDRVLADITSNRNVINSVGHGLATNVQTSFLSYEGIGRQASVTGDVEEATLITFDNDSNNVPQCTITYDLSVVTSPTINIEKGDYLPANANYAGRFAKVKQVSKTTVGNVLTLIIKTDIPIEQSAIELIDDENFTVASSTFATAHAAGATTLFIANTTNWLLASTTPAVDHLLSFTDSVGATTANPTAVTNYTSTASGWPVSSGTNVIEVDHAATKVPSASNTFAAGYTPAQGDTTLFITATADMANWIATGDIVYTNSASPTAPITVTATALANHSVIDTSATVTTVETDGAYNTTAAGNLTLIGTLTGWPRKGTLIVDGETIVYSAINGQVLTVTSCTTNNSGTPYMIPDNTACTSVIGIGWEATLGTGLAANPPAAGSSITGEVYGFAYNGTALTLSGTLTGMRPAGVITIGSHTLTYSAIVGQVLTIDSVSSSFTANTPILNDADVTQHVGFWEWTVPAIANTIANGAAVSGETYNQHLAEVFNYYKSFESAATEYFPIPLGKATFTAATIPNALGMLSGTGLAGALADKDMIDYRYLIDTFTSPGLLTKKEISTLARTRQNASAILNAPTVEDFKNNTAPGPTFKNTDGVFKTSYIKDGGNLAQNPTTLYALPGITDGANFAFYYGPGLLCKDNGKNKVVPPAAYVSNNYIDKYTAATPWSIVAGPRRGVVSGPGIVGAEYTFDKDDRDILEPFGINPIVFQRGVGLTILGNKTGQQSIKSALSSAHVREVLIYMQNGIADILKDYVFEFNTVQTRLEIKTLVDSFMESVKQEDGVYDYKNIMDSTNNDTEVIDNNMGIVDTYVEPVKGLEIVVHRTTVLNTGEIATGSYL